MTTPDPDAANPSSKPLWRRWWMLVIYAFVGLIVLSAVFAPDEDDDDGEDVADRDTTTTTTAEATEPEGEVEAEPTTTAAPEQPAEEPIQLTGSGTTNSDPVTLSGDYTTTADFGTCPVVDTWVKPVDAPDDALRWHQVSEGEGNVYGVEDGEYFLAVISCPEAWTVTLTPR